MAVTNDDLRRDLSPVSDPGERAPQEGIALCLSGGGYRARRGWR